MRKDNVAWKTGVNCKAYPIFSRIRGGEKVINMIASLRRFDKDKVAAQRMKIIKFYKQYGERATNEAFGVDRKLVNCWRKRLSELGGKLTALIPHSTRPRNVRQPQTYIGITDFIRGEREKRKYKVGKEKLKGKVDKFCREKGIPTVSISTIGNIIKRNNYFHQKEGRIYHNPNSKCALRNETKKKRLRVRHSPKPKEFDYIVSDSVERITDGIRDYFTSAVDAKENSLLRLTTKG